MVRSRFNRPRTIASPIGDGHSSVFEERIVEGKTKLVKVGSEDLNEFVQKSLPETLIYNILRKYENGNIEVLNKAIGQYFDSTVFPSSLAEAHNIVKSAHKSFESLPLEIRAKFDHSSDVYLQKIFDGSFVDLFPKDDKPVVKDGDGVES